MSTIIQSSSDSEKAKKAMLLNSDIEELNNKIKNYYLEKKSLPIDKDNKKYMYYNGSFGDPGTLENDIPAYYRLVISELENLSLNEKEKIDLKADSLTDKDIQWYVINEETHTIYFVKKESSVYTIQNAKYSEKYSSIILATGNKFNKPGIGEGANSQTVSEATTVLGGEQDTETKQNPNEGNVETRIGTNTNPGEKAGVGEYLGAFDYVGYTYNWIPGTSSDNLVLHYDGISNQLNNSNHTLSHSNNTVTWSDLSGHNLDGRIAKGSWSLTSNGTETDNRIIGNISNCSSNWSNNKMNLSGDEYIVCDFTNSIRSVPTFFPKNGESYTIEMCIDNSGNYTDDRELFSLGKKINTDINGFDMFNELGTGKFDSWTEDNRVEWMTLQEVNKKNYYPPTLYIPMQYHAVNGSRQKNNRDSTSVNFDNEFKRDYANLENKRTEYFNHLKEVYENGFSGDVFPYSNPESVSDVILSSSLSKKINKDKMTDWSNEVLPSVRKTIADEGFYFRYSFYTSTEKSWGTKYYWFQWFYGTTFEIAEHSSDIFKSKTPRFKLISDGTIKTDGGIGNIWGDDTISANKNKDCLTVSFVWDANNKKYKIYVDGNLVYTYNERIDSSFIINEIVYEFIVGANSNTKYTYNEANDIITANWLYDKCLNSPLYSVRVYNTVLEDDLIRKNYLVDQTRFN